MRWHVGFYPTTLLELAILVSIAVFVVENRRARLPIAWRSSLVFPAAVFIVAGAISVVSAPDRVAALGLYRAYLLEPIAFALVLGNVLTEARRALYMVAGLALGGVVAGVANSVVVLNALVHHAYEVTQTPPVVIYLTANATALFLVPLIALAGSVALHATDSRERVLAVAFVAVATVSVILSFSRGGYLALAAVAIGLALSHRRRILLLGATALAAAVTFLIPPIQTRILIETRNVYGNTVYSRLDLWTDTIALLRQRPLVGAGLAGFHTRIAPFWNPQHPTVSFIDPHNIVLNFWVETGLLGLLAFAWLLVLAFGMSWKGWRHGISTWRPIQLGVLLALVAVVVHGLVDVPYFKNDLSLEFWTLLGMSWAGSVNSA